MLVGLRLVPAFYPEILSRIKDLGGRLLAENQLADIVQRVGTDRFGPLELTAEDGCRIEGVVDFHQVLAVQVGPELEILSDGLRSRKNLVDHDAVDIDPVKMHEGVGSLRLENGELLGIEHKAECHRRIEDELVDILHLLEQYVDLVEEILVGNVLAHGTGERGHAFIELEKLLAHVAPDDYLRIGQQAEGVACRRGIQHDRVPFSGLRFVDQPAESENLVESRLRGQFGRHAAVDSLVLIGRGNELLEPGHVLFQFVDRIDLQSVEILFYFLGFVPADRSIEHIRQRVRGIGGHDQHFLVLPCKRHRGGRGNRGLARAALARIDDYPWLRLSFFKIPRKHRMVLLFLDERPERNLYFRISQRVSVILIEQAARCGAMADDTGTTYAARRLQSNKSTIFQRQIKRVFLLNAL